MQYFRDPSITYKDYFDDAPTPQNKKKGAKDGMSTSEIDAFRQGVEITQPGHYDAGIYKIHSGDPGHMLRQTTFGEDKKYIIDSPYDDSFLFDPINYVSSGGSLTRISQKSPINLVSTYDPLYRNGALEPLVIRARNPFSKEEFIRRPKGSVMAGTELIDGSSCLIQSIVSTNKQTRPLPFEDSYVPTSLGSRYKTYAPSMKFVNASIPTPTVPSTGKTITINGSNFTQDIAITLGSGFTRVNPSVITIASSTITITNVSILSTGEYTISLSKSDGDNLKITFVKSGSSLLTPTTDYTRTTATEIYTDTTALAKKPSIDVCLSKGLGSNESFADVNPLWTTGNPNVAYANVSIGGKTESSIMYSLEYAPRSKSTNCGYTFDDSTIHGTDSIAFGGMTY